MVALSGADAFGPPAAAVSPPAVVPSAPKVSAGSTAAASALQFPLPPTPPAELQFLLSTLRRGVRGFGAAEALELSGIIGRGTDQVWMWGACERSLGRQQT